MAAPERAGQAGSEVRPRVRRPVSVARPAFVARPVSGRCQSKRMRASTGQWSDGTGPSAKNGRRRPATVSQRTPGPV